MKLTEQLPKFIPQGNRFEPFYYEKSNVNFSKICIWRLKITLCKPKYYRIAFSVSHHFLCFFSLYSSGSVEALLTNLSSPNEEVRSSAAVALGYLSFDRTASRLMLQACRNTPGLLESLVDNLGNGKVSMEFMDEWRQTKMVGLPSARYAITYHAAFDTKS